MEMNIKISDYLSEDEIKEIVKEEFRSRLRNHFDSEYNIGRIITNCAYRNLGEELEKLVPNYKKSLGDNIKNIFESKDSIRYELFSNDMFSNRKSSGEVLIEEYLKNNKKLLEDKIKETILGRDLSDKIYEKATNLIDEMGNNMYEFINLLKEKDNGK